MSKNRYVVVYAKVTDNKESGALMSGVYFGGVASTVEEADKIAERCVAETQGGLVIPKVAKMHTDDLLEVIKVIEGRFDELAKQMYENERIASRRR